jgi:hypothetical protein
MTEDMNSLFVRSKGWLDETYEDFYNEIFKWKSSVGLIWLRVEDVEGLFVIFWAGEVPD